MKKQNGITLIALIITIIVMLILVGVTINVALNGGLFGITEEAASNTQMEAEREQLLSAVVTAYDTETGTINKGKLEANLGTGWTVEGDTAPYTVTSPKGNKFTVAANGTIEYEEKNSDKDVTLPEGLTVGSEFEMDANKDGTKETWIVLYDGTADHLNENEIEVISKDTMGNLTLGANDTEATNATDIDGNGTLEDIEKAIYSYNNAIDRINNYCASLIKIDNLGVRSVGSKPSNPSYKNTTIPSATAKNVADSWSNKTAWETYGVLGEEEDTNYSGDCGQMTEKIQQSGNKARYWIASRVVTKNSGYVRFNVRSIGESGYIGQESFWYVESSGRAYPNVNSCTVRPIIKLQYK